jgi:ABC-type bacteriocin/lantibiotic exporter with double-glycine peptidase domain
LEFLFEMKLCCIAVLLILGGTSIAEPASGQTRAAAAPAIWIDVPFAAQTKDGCGSASISMVMQYWDRKKGRPAGADADPEKIQAALFSRAAGGIFASSMQKYLQKAGYRAFAFQGQWADLEHHLALGRPMIVGVNASGPRGPLHRGPLHYIVVVGIDSERGYVFVNDPAQQKMLRISREGFESEWRSTGDWTLLAVPQSAR